MIKIFQQFHEFLSDFTEWHAFWIGWSDAIWFYKKPRFPKVYIEERHYYGVGGAFGVFTLIVIGILIWLLVKGG